jgi:hypothetical protein
MLVLSVEGDKKNALLLLQGKSTAREVCFDNIMAILSIALPTLSPSVA